LTINERILEAQIKHSVYLERYKGGVLRKIIGMLNDTEADLIELIAGRLATIEGRGFDLSQAETKRLNKLLEDIRDKRADTYSVLNDQLSEEMNDFSQYEADFQIRLSNNAGVQAAFAMPSNAQLKAIVTSQPFRGRLLKEWAQGLAQEEVKRVHDAIRIGMTEGQTTDQIIRRIRGSKKNRFQDGILEISRRDAEAITRTAISHVANRARSEVYGANADIVRKLIYISTLDSRTTSYCIQHDRKVYDIGKQPVIPQHFRCRSIYCPFFEDDEQGDRASVFGPVPASTDYDTFLRKQSKEFQEDVLGVERARLYRAGKEPVGKFIDRSGKFYTLKELKTRET